MSDETVARRLNLELDVFLQLKEKIAAVTGDEIKLLTEDTEHEAPHLFVMVMPSRAGKAGVPWIYCGGSTGRPYDQTDDGRAHAPTRFKKALKTYGRKAFIKIPVHVCGFAFNQASVENVVASWVNSMNGMRDPRFFNNPNTKDDDVNTGDVTPAADEVTAEAVDDKAAAKAAKAAEKEAKEAEKAAAKAAKEAEKAEKAAAKEAAEAEAKAKKEAEKAEKAAERERFRAERAAERAAKKEAEKAEGGERPARAGRASKELLSPRVEKWTKGRLADLATHLPEAADIGVSYPVAKLWYETKKSAGEENLQAAVASMKDELMKRGLIAA